MTSILVEELAGIDRECCKTSLGWIQGLETCLRRRKQGK